MAGLIGELRDGTKVSYDDKQSRDFAIDDLKQIFRWNLKYNPIPKRIDLVHKNGRRGGVDVEHGHWKGLYRNQSPDNFNQFTEDIPTANFPYRKEHYFNEKFTWTNHYDDVVNSEDPDYKYNILMRYNSSYNEFFLVYYSVYKKILPDRGFWQPGTATTGKPELWMCWRLCDVIFYIKENGIWRRDRTLEDPKTYQEYIEEYKKNKIIYETVS